MKSGASLSQANRGEVVARRRMQETMQARRVVKTRREEVPGRNERQRKGRTPQ